MKQKLMTHFFEGVTLFRRYSWVLIADCYRDNHLSVFSNQLFIGSNNVYLNWRNWT